MKNMNRYLSLVALIISLISCQSEDNPNRYELIPYPNDMEQMSGRSCPCCIQVKGVKYHSRISSGEIG